MTFITTEIAEKVVDNVSKFGRDYLYDLVNPIEQSIRHAVKDVNPHALREYDRFLKTGDTLSKNFPLMNPFYVVLILVAYLAMIFVGKLLMKLKKEPFKPRFFQIIHNAFLTLVSAFMAFECIHQAYVNKYSLFQNPMNHSEKAMARIVWIFYFSKILEFGDTLIMVLKKSDRQISFLHVYHHTTIFAIWWAVTKWGPGGEAYFSVILNSIVHVVMYAYYLSTTIGLPLNVIKPYITSMQMFQFMLMMVQSAYDLVMGCPGYPRPLIVLLFGYMITLLALFANFFRKDAARRREARRAGNTGNTAKIQATAAKGGKGKPKKTD